MSKLFALRSSYHGDAIDKAKDCQRLREWLAFVKIGFMSYELVPFAKGCRRDHYAVNKISRLVSMDGSQKKYGLSMGKGVNSVIVC